MSEFNNRSFDDLAKAYSVIICEYETLENTYLLYNRLKKRYFKEKKLQKRMDIRWKINDCLTLFCVHTRNLACFFIKDYRRKPDDIKIEDFGLSYSIFDKCDSYKIINNSLVKRINKEISHLTYEHIKDFEERSWDTEAIYIALKVLYEIFVFNVKEFNFFLTFKSLALDKDFFSSLFGVN